MTQNLTKLFQNVLKEQIDCAVDELLADGIRSQLDAQGVASKSAPVDALIRHIRSDSVEDFVWEADAEHQAVTLDLSDVADEIPRFVDAIDTGELQTVFTDVHADLLLSALMDDWPEQRAHEDEQLSGFRERLMLLWDQPLSLFRILLTCSEECFDEYAASLRRSKARKGTLLRQALFYVHGRVLRTAKAVRVLLEHGMADDAYALCRTLYELYVAGSFISDHGDDAGRRYIDHNAVDRRKRMKREIAWGADIPKALQCSIEADYERVIRIHGESFGSDYGWASKFLPKNNKGQVNGNPKIGQLAHETLGGGLPEGHPPFYVASSLQVHPGITGAFGVAAGGEPLFPIGYSNTGLEVPLMNAAHWLAQSSALLQDHLPSRDEVRKTVIAEVIFRLEEKIGEESIACAEEVERETSRRKKLRRKK